MDERLLEAVGSAYAAFAAGDVEPLLALLDPEVEWRGVAAGGHDPPS